MRLTNRPEFQQLAATLGSRATALGTLMLLSEAPPPYDSWMTVEFIADWRGQPQALYEALAKHGFLRLEEHGLYLTVSVKAQPKDSVQVPETGFGPQALVALYNEHRGRMTECQRLTGGRLKAAVARLKECPDPEPWKAAIRYCAGEPWYTGKNDRNWVAGIDYFLRSNTLTKLQERMCRQREVVQVDSTANEEWLRRKGWLSDDVQPLTPAASAVSEDE